MNFVNPPRTKRPSNPASIPTSAPPSAKKPSRDALHGGDRAASFFLEMTVLMGLPADNAEVLAKPEPFFSPNGLKCRLLLRPDSEKTAVQPQILLPIAAAMLKGKQVERLLTVQGAMMFETGWYLGLGPGGGLQMTALEWMETPPNAVAALDLGNVIALQALQLLIDDSDAQEPTPPEPSVKPSSGPPGARSLRPRGRA